MNRGGHPRRLATNPPEDGMEDYGRHGESVVPAVVSFNHGGGECESGTFVRLEPGMRNLLEKGEWDGGFRQTGCGHGVLPFRDSRGSWAVVFGVVVENGAGGAVGNSLSERGAFRAVSSIDIVAPWGRGEVEVALNDAVEQGVGDDVWELGHRVEYSLSGSDFFGGGVV